VNLRRVEKSTLLIFIEVFTIISIKSMAKICILTKIKDNNVYLLKRLNL